MVTSLIHHERIMVTTARAKELRKVAENMVTYAKKGTSLLLFPICHINQTVIGQPIHRTLAGAVIREKSALVKLFSILGPRYELVYLMDFFCSIVI